MDYKKECEEMVQRVKELHETGNALTKKQMEIICPELAESDDERIRKHIIEILNDLPGCYWYGQKEKDDTIAYLEKMKVFEQSEGLYLYKDRSIYLVGRPAEEKIQIESLHIPETCKENADSFTNEDEKILEQIINFFECQKRDEPTREDILNKWISYLEKQKEWFGSGQGLYYYDGEKTIYCGYILWLSCNERKSV